MTKPATYREVFKPVIVKNSVSFGLYLNCTISDFWNRYWQDDVECGAFWTEYEAQQAAETILNAPYGSRVEYRLGSHPRWFGPSKTKTA